MKMYAGIDLHSNNSHVAVLDENLKTLTCRRLHNDLLEVLEFLEPYRSELVAAAVESTYNWYWLVDGLMAAGLDMRLVNTTKAKTYSGMKYTDDRHDARWIAHLLGLGILPEGYIAPPAVRGIRDLLRKRLFIVQKRTSCLLAMKSVFARETGKSIPVEELRKWTSDSPRQMFGKGFVAESIATLIPIVRVMNQEIRKIERVVLKEMKPRREFGLLQTIPGLGRILAMTIVLETGDISRFASAGHYASYCRCVPTCRLSNAKRKGSGNRKNGNKYLSWAFGEVANYLTRYEPKAKSFYDRKRSKSHVFVARRALANKASKAAFFILRDKMVFNAEKVFC